MSLFSGFLTWADNQRGQQHECHDRRQSPKRNSVVQLQFGHTSFHPDFRSRGRVDITIIGILAARNRYFFAIGQFFGCAPIVLTVSSTTSKSRLHSVPQKPVYRGQVTGVIISWKNNLVKMRSAGTFFILGRKFKFSPKITFWKISIFTKFTLWKNHFDKIHILKIPFSTKFTF